MRRMWAAFGVAVFVVALPAGAGEKLAMHVSPSYSYAPATLIVQVSVAPDSENRAVRVIAESSDFYRSSDIELDGERAARTSVLWYASLPAGDYQVRGVLFGAGGRERAMVVQSVTVIGAGGR